jgi:ribosomal subunit interface protein
MDMSIRGRQLELSDFFKNYVQRRLSFAISKFDSRVRDVEVVVCDVNGPRGGVDKACAITATVRPIGRVFARAVDIDSYSAVDSAVSRLRTVLVRRLRQRKEPRRRDIRAILRIKYAA